MSFSVRSVRQGARSTVTLESAGTDEAVEIVPDLGGTVTRLRLRFPDGSADVLARDTPEELEANPWFRGRLLFPFNDRIPAGRYTFGGQEYRLPLNEAGGAIHGFLFARSLKVSELTAGETAAALGLEYSFSGAEEAGYPFPLTVSVTYRLMRGRFSVALHVRNDGGRPAPLAFGWHPYYTLGAGADAVRLTAGFGSVAVADDASLPTGELRPIPPGGPYDFSAGRPLAGLEPDHGFTVPPSGTLELSTEKRRLILRQDPEIFRYVQLFIPPDRASVAVEPVTSAANSFNLPHLGRIELEPGCSVGGTFEVETAAGG